MKPQKNRSKKNKNKKVLPFFCAIIVIVALLLVILKYPIPALILSILSIGALYWYFDSRRDFERRQHEYLLHDRIVSIDTISGAEFEELIADVMEKNGFESIELTKSSGDYGIDILAEKNGLRYAVQCKRYSKNVGNHAVQEAFSGKAFYDADIAVVATNADFTSAAVETADKTGVELWDGEYLHSLIENASKELLY